MALGHPLELPQQEIVQALAGLTGSDPDQGDFGGRGIGCFHGAGRAEADRDNNRSIKGLNALLQIGIMKCHVG